MVNTGFQSMERSLYSDREALAIATQAKVLSGNKLEQLVVRLQRHSGQTKLALRVGTMPGTMYFPGPERAIHCGDLAKIRRPVCTLLRMLWHAISSLLMLEST